MLSPYCAPGIRKLDLPVLQQNSKDRIVKIVCDYKGLNFIEITTKKRYRDLVYCRHLCMFFLKNKTTMTWNDIGKLFGGRDHTTAIHAHHSISQLKDVEEQVKEDIQNIENKINFGR